MTPGQPTGAGATLLKAALGYASRGIPVLALHHPVATGERGPDVEDVGACSCGRLDCLQASEHPLSPGGVHDASTDPAEIRAWWQRDPLANVGLATGVRFDAADADADTGRIALKRIEDHAAPAGPVAQTGSGRWQFFVAPTGMPDSIQWGMGARRALRWHGRGGYVVAAPSRHVTGTVTRWLHPLTRVLPERQQLLHELLVARDQPPPG
jgi:hypothetical protein